MQTWRHVSHSAPCPICGHPNWCSFSADGVWMLCRRVDNGTGLHRVDKAGADYWLYRRDGHVPSRRSTDELPS